LGCQNFGDSKNGKLSRKSLREGVGTFPHNFRLFAEIVGLNSVRRHWPIVAGKVAVMFHLGASLET
jgi:hypothetical protein